MFEFRSIRKQEYTEAALIEQECFPENEACPEEMMLARAGAAPDLFLIAEDTKTGKMAGYLNGLSTNEDAFRDEFFSDTGLYDPSGENVMLLGLSVLPEYRRQGLATELVRRYVYRERANGRRKLILTCLDDKVAMYEKMGFTDMGLSASVWGGEQWHEMVFILKES